MRPATLAAVRARLPAKHRLRASLATGADRCAISKGFSAWRELVTRAREREGEAKGAAGVEDGPRIRFSGLGEAGAFAGPAGDLYIVLHVKEHAFFEREGNDLHCVVPISFPQAAMGTEIVVPTLEGEHKLKVPEGTQSGTSFRIRNKGVPMLNSHGKGDLNVEVRIQTPGK